LTAPGTDLQQLWDATATGEMLAATRMQDRADAGSVLLKLLARGPVRLTTSL